MKYQFFLLVIIALTVTSCVAQNSETISPREFSAKIAQPSTLVDVRTEKEFNSGHLKDAINLDVNGANFAKQTESLDKTKPVLLYCMAGVRSRRAADMLRQKGFVVFDLKGGIEAWKEAGLPVTGPQK